MESKPLNNLSMIICTIVVGSIVSLSVILFIKLFALVHNLCFISRISFLYNENAHTPQSILGFGIIFVPVIGSLLVTWLIERFASNERGLSVTAIIYSIHFDEGKIKPIPAFAKAIASIVSIGSGGSLGREGPIIQLSAAFSAIIGMRLVLSSYQKSVLIAAGAAAGTTVIFNTPVGALAFVIEILLGAINFFSISLIVLAEIIALLIRYYFLGDFSLFTTIAFEPFQQISFFKQLLLLLPFGIALGVVSTFFIRGIYFTEDFFVKHFKNPYIRHATGMFFVGIMLYILMFFFGHYYIEGIGIATINDALHFIIQNPWLLLLLLLFKLLATFFTLGSGASGGIFAPTLFIGAILGVLWMMGSHYIVGIDFNASYVVAGMAGMLAGVTGGMMMSIILCIEMTKDYQQILPILITTTFAYLTRMKLCQESVYTLKLKRNQINYQQ